MKPAPWKIPASDPLEGGSVDWIPVVKEMLVIGQTWAIPDSYTKYSKSTHLTFQINNIQYEEAYGTLRSYDDLNQLRWERPHSFGFGYFAGHMRDQERRPILIDGPQNSLDIDPTATRARLIEV